MMLLLLLAAPTDERVTDAVDTPNNPPRLVSAARATFRIMVVCMICVVCMYLVLLYPAPNDCHTVLVCPGIGTLSVSERGGRVWRRTDPDPMIAGG